MAQTHKFELSSDTQKLIIEAKEMLENVRNALEEETQQHRDAFSERSEKWQEGEKGQATDTWIENLDGLFENLDTAVTHLEDYQPEPED